MANKVIFGLVYMQTVTQSKVLAQLSQLNSKFLVYYGASWCGPCKKFLPIVSKFAESNRLGVKCVKVDIDEFEAADSDSDSDLVNSVPTVKLFKNGKCISTCCGAQTEHSFNMWMLQNWGSRAPTA